jgi:hypothetical protein
MIICMAMWNSLFTISSVSTYLSDILHCTEEPLLEKGNVNKCCFLSVQGCHISKNAVRTIIKRCCCDESGWEQVNDTAPSVLNIYSAQRQRVKKERCHHMSGGDIQNTMCNVTDMLPPTPITVISYWLFLEPMEWNDTYYEHEHIHIGK